MPIIILGDGQEPAILTQANPKRDDPNTCYLTFSEGDSTIEVASQVPGIDAAWWKNFVGVSLHCTFDCRARYFERRLLLTATQMVVKSRAEVMAKQMKVADALLTQLNGAPNGKVQA